MVLFKYRVERTLCLWHFPIVMVGIRLIPLHALETETVYTLIIVYARLDGLELRANCLHALEKMLQTVMFVARKEIAHLETHVNAILVT
jgi:hypothetical protein